MSVHSIAFAHSGPADLLAAAETVAASARANADSLDAEATAFPAADIAALHDAGLLVAPFPTRFGGAGIASGDAATRILRPMLQTIGAASLPLGRLYEGHVNAIGLVAAYGAPEQIAMLRAEAAEGALFGVWAADDAAGLKLARADDGGRLAGRKILCSGAPFIERPLITAKDAGGHVFMAIPKIARGERADLSRWTPQGMRASATGTVDFDGVHLEAGEIVGAADDYHRQPRFSGGAWRFLAVQLGAVRELHDLLRKHLVASKRGGDPHQAARFGQAAIAAETARLWVERASIIAESEDGDPAAAVAYVNLARLAVERAALDVLEIVHRSVGLSAFMRPHPIERVSRDLATYLRQPAPDSALCGAAAWLLARDEGAKEWGRPC
jgi:alkylation response protein AidB-like acyl-CoA dehydrogenase